MIDVDDDEAVAELDVLVVDGEQFATGDAVPHLMATAPWTLPQSVVVQFRRPIPNPPSAEAGHQGSSNEPALSLFELENHFTVQELRAYVVEHDVLPAPTAAKGTKHVLARAIRALFDGDATSTVASTHAP